MPKILRCVGETGLLLLVLGAASTLAVAAKKDKFHAKLSGGQEVPSVSTTGEGEFEAEVNAGETSLAYELRYSNLPGTVTAAHVHFGQRGVAGGVMFFLCGGGGKPACPTNSGTVTGTVAAADIIGPAAQGIAAGQFAKALEALRDGLAYANAHTNTYPGGEIRGQIGSGKKGHKDKDKGKDKAEEDQE